MTARLMGQRTVASVAKIEALGAAAQARAASAAIFRGARAKAERVVRTEVLNAYNTYSVDLIREVAKEDDRILKRWDAMFDGRLCGDCRSMHGIAIPVAEKFPFPSGESAPPLHPHCRCTTVIWRSDWGDHEGQSARKGMIKLQGWPET
jgi:SPP1 gp7 family putative phage head morphogenesis protein